MSFVASVAKAVDDRDSQRSLPALLHSALNPGRTKPAGSIWWLPLSSCGIPSRWNRLSRRSKARNAGARRLPSHLSPLGWEHINLTGDYLWDLRQTTTLQRLRTLRRGTLSVQNGPEAKAG